MDSCASTSGSPNCQSSLGFQNKLEDVGVIIRNKIRLAAKGFTQIKDLDYDETIAPVPHLKAICIFLADVSHKSMKVYHMDVKSAFLMVNTTIKFAFNNLLVLSISIFWTTTTNSRKFCMALSKLLDLGRGLLHVFWSDLVFNKDWYYPVLKNQ